ncbi:MAG: hypothetical protein AAFR02_00065 [Pseudomonadota bacterium]
MDPDTARLKAAEDARDKARQRLQKAKPQFSAQERKSETRRNILIGSVIREYAQANPDTAFARELTDILSRQITRQKDRDLLGIDEMREAQPSSHDVIDETDLRSAFEG